MPLARKAFRDQVQQLLEGLGPRVADVAASLGGAGVKGIPKNGQCCALATYLHAVLEADGQVRHINVGVCGVEVVFGSWWRRRVWIAHPAAVSDFVRAFDAGVFPRLTRYPLNAGEAQEQTH